MRNEARARGGVGRVNNASLSDMPLEASTWQIAWKAFLDEDYVTSLKVARECLDSLDSKDSAPVALVPDPDAPTVKDGIVLCAWNLFQLERFDDFEILHASAGRWGTVPADMPELEVVRLAFACKRGEYLQVVDAASEFIASHRHALPPVIADYLYLRGQARSALGDPDSAAGDVEAAYSVFRLLGRQLDSARTANLLGVLAFRAADYAEARQWFERAHEWHSRLGMIKNMGGNRLNIGMALYKQGSFSRALTELQAATRLLEEVGAQTSLCRARIATGNALRLMRDFRAAREQLRTAYEKANFLMLSREEALALEFLGDVHRDEGRLEKARRYYSRALAIGTSIAPDGDIVMEVLRRQGECLEMLGRQAEAVPVLSRALGLARRLGDRFEEGVIKRVMAATMLGLGDLESAGHYCADAADLLSGVGGRHELAISRLLAAEIHIARLESGICADPSARLDTAWHDAMSALGLFLKMESDHWILKARKSLTNISRRRADEEEAERMVVSADRMHGSARRHLETPIVHVSSCMRDVIQLTDAFADSEEPVLITGETGTGKELFARRLHRRSGRRAKELVCVNVSAIPESIFAREIFGHTRGSFSGAETDGIGLAAKADGGTLFLDEIGDLPWELQPRLLRLLQDGSYQAIGDPSERHTNIRLIAATNADLKKLVAAGKFRADLYYRLKILELRLPPISERREDILPLLRHFLEQATGQAVALTAYFGQASLDVAQAYDWPGNVREIAMVAHQAQVQLASRGEVRVEVGETAGEPIYLTGPQVTDEGPRGRIVGRISATTASRSRILLALAEANGNRAKAARGLGVSRSTLYRQMEKLGIAGKVYQS